MSVSTKTWLRNPQLASVKDKKDFLYSLGNELYTLLGRRKAKNTNNNKIKSIENSEEDTLKQLEHKCFKIVVPTKEWLSDKYLDSIVVEFYMTEKYSKNSCYGLVRCIRNTIDHYLDHQAKQDYEPIKAIIGQTAYEVTEYFIKIFPNLLPVLTQFVVKNKNVLTDTYTLLKGYPKLPGGYPTADDVILGLATSLQDYECRSERLLCGFKNMWSTDNHVIFVSPPPDYKIAEYLTTIRICKEKVTFYHEDNDHKLEMTLKSPCDFNLLIVLAKSTDKVKDLIADSQSVNVICITDDSSKVVKEVYRDLCKTEEIIPETIKYNWSHYTADTQVIFCDKVVTLAGKEYKFSELFCGVDGTLASYFQPYVTQKLLRMLLSKKLHLWKQSTNSAEAKQQLFKSTKNSSWNIVTGRPYVGKSVSVKQYVKNSDHFVFLVNIETSFKFKNDICPTTFSEVLEALSGKSKLEIELLKHICASKHKVELVIDGLDNLLRVYNVDEGSKFIQIIIESIKIFSKTVADFTIWVVTRPHCAQYISSMVSVVQRELVGIDRNLEKCLIENFVASKFKNAKQKKVFSENIMKFFQAKFHMTVFAWDKIVQKVINRFPLNKAIEFDQLSMCKMMVKVYFTDKFPFEKVRFENLEFLHVELALSLLKRTVEVDSGIYKSIEFLEKELKYFNRTMKEFQLTRIDIGLIRLKGIQNWKNTFSFYDACMPNYFVAIGLLKTPLYPFEGARAHSIKSRSDILNYIESGFSSEPVCIQCSLIKHFYDEMVKKECNKEISQEIEDALTNLHLS